MMPETTSNIETAITALIDPHTAQTPTLDWLIPSGEDQLLTGPEA